MSDEPRTLGELLPDRHRLPSQPFKVDDMGDMRVYASICKIDDRVFIEVKHRGFLLYKKQVDAGDAQRELYAVKGLILWNKRLVSPEYDPRPAHRHISKMMGTHVQCFICYDYSDTSTPCYHDICSRCFLKTFKLDPCISFKCGMCRREFVYQGDDDWAERNTQVQDMDEGEDN